MYMSCAACMHLLNSYNNPGLNVFNLFCAEMLRPSNLGKHGTLPCFNNWKSSSAGTLCCIKLQHFWNSSAPTFAIRRGALMAYSKFGGAFGACFFHLAWRFFGTCTVGTKVSGSLFPFWNARGQWRWRIHNIYHKMHCIASMRAGVWSARVK